MELKRYMMLENGKVIDRNHIDFWDILEGKILATSPDIWGLVKEGWLYGLQYKNGSRTFLTVKELSENDTDSFYQGRKTVISRCGWHTPRENIDSLYAPIYTGEYGKGNPARYEKVWERTGKDE